MALGIEIVDSPAVRQHNALEAPLVTQNLLQQTVASAARLVFIPVVGAHHLLHTGLLDQSLESRQVGLAQVTRLNVLGIELMAVPLRTAVNSKVLGTGV